MSKFSKQRHRLSTGSAKSVQRLRTGAQQGPLTKSSISSEVWNPVAVRYETEESVIQLQKTVQLVVLNAIDGYLSGRGFRIEDFEAATAFQQSLGIDRRYLSNVLAALRGLGFVAPVGDNQSDLDRCATHGGRGVDSNSLVKPNLPFSITVGLWMSTHGRTTRRSTPLSTQYIAHTSASGDRRSKRST